MDEIFRLSPRLKALAESVRRGARLIDVGTDHAYLPIYLAERGEISAALATDVASGPIARAQANVTAARLEGIVRTMRTPGLQGTVDFAPTDVVIAGMGGELIASILAAEPYLRSERIRLILQPMTKQEILRTFLAENGFETEREMLICEDDRIYQALVAVYAGRASRLSPLEALVGRLNLEEGGELLRTLLEKKKRQIKKAAAGKRKGGENPVCEDALLLEIDAYLNG